ncbi:biosynthetic peptidoglycan transglycosylase [Eisenbergiella sp.]
MIIKIKQLFVFFFAAAALCGGIQAGLGYKLYRDALTRQSLENRVLEIRAATGYTSVSELPEAYLKAVIAVQGCRYEQNSEIDFYAAARTAWRELISWKRREGGGTVSLRLAESMYFPQGKGIVCKAAEAFMALKIEKTYTEEEILELYVNSVYFVRGYYCVRDSSIHALTSLGTNSVPGYSCIRDASIGYFGKEPMALSDRECILLAEIPDMYSP